MKPEDKTRAEAVLRHVCLGRHLCGVHFYAAPVLLMYYREGPAVPEAYLTIEGGWHVDTQSARGSASAGVLQQPIEELARLACLLRRYPIVGVELGQTAPHLILTFGNGQILFVDGHHDRFESWNVYAGESGEFTVIAAPGDEVVESAPADFWVG